MMSRTIRYFKLIYIVAGILMSNEEVCETVDQIQIPPRIEIKETLQPKKIKDNSSVEKRSKPRSWFAKFDIFGLNRIKRRVLPILSGFNIWTIPNYLLDSTTNYISNKFVINSNCDVIYNR